MIIDLFHQSNKIKSKCQLKIANNSAQIKAFKIVHSEENKMFRLKSERIA